MGKDGTAKTSVDVLVSIKHPDTDEKIIIGGQRGATLNQERAAIDATHKLNYGWSSTKAGQGSWSIDTDGILLYGDESQALLHQAFLDARDVEVDFTIPGIADYQGTASIMSMPIEAPMGDVVTWSTSFSGQGPYVYVDRSSEPEPGEPTGGEQ